MATQKQQQTLEKYVDVIHELVSDQVQLLESGDRQITKNRALYARMFSQLLYDAPAIFTGLVSVDMVDKKLHNFKAKPCPEHFLSRQRGGESLIALIENSLSQSHEPSRSDVRDIVTAHCAVHYTTPEENALLKRFQRQHHDETAYKRAGIILIEARDLFTKRGHGVKWKEQMCAKYGPVVQHHLTSSILIKDNQ